MYLLVIFLILDLAMECNGAFRSLPWFDIVSTSNTRACLEYPPRIIIKYSMIANLSIDALWNSCRGIESRKRTKLLWLSLLQLYLYNCFFHQTAFFLWETLTYRLLHFLIYISKWGKVSLCISTSLHKSILSCYGFAHSVHMSANGMNEVLKINIVSLRDLLLFCCNLIFLLDRRTFNCVLTSYLPMLESLLL